MKRHRFLVSVSASIAAAIAFGSARFFWIACVGGSGSGDDRADGNSGVMTWPVQAEEEDFSFPSSHILDSAAERTRGLQESDNSEGEGPWVYSKYATVVPDPIYHAKTGDAENLGEEWESWDFWDGTEDERPSGDYCAKYPFRDVPGDEFPDDSWQVDSVFVNHILFSGEKLVQRAQDVIFAEYGYEKNLQIHELLERNKMFRWEKVDMSNEQFKPTPDGMRQGGWTSQRSMNGLSRRLLHAIMSNDEFVVAIVGGSAATGDGNHFRQSYSMQLHRVVAPVLARLGVKLVTRNLSHRHIGTLPAALAKSWGGDIDLLIWDGGRFEHSRREKDLFLRQVLLSGKEKVPVVWLGGVESDWDLLRIYHEQAGIDVGRFGTGLYGIPIITESKMIESLPHAARYLRCDKNAAGLCQHPHDEFCAKCWIDRSDIPNAKALFPNITDRVPNQLNWNPGWRQHQLTGRLLAFSILEALQDALQTFISGSGGGAPLADEEWHMGDYYKGMRDRLTHISPEKTGCSRWENVLPDRVCSVPLHGATQHTPRAGPSIVDIVKVGSGTKPENPQTVLYEGQDVHNSCFDPGEGAPNVVGVVSARRRIVEQISDEEELMLQLDMPVSFAKVHASRVSAAEQCRRRQQPSSGSLQTGSGWIIVDEAPGVCNGEYMSICGRQASNPCPLLGHHDSQGQIQGHGSSGWFVLYLENLQKGLIILGINLASPSSVERRRLRYDDPLDSFPDSFALDVSVDGKVTSWDKQMFSERYRRQIQRGFDALVLLDDEQFSASAETVEVGLRLRECGAQCKLGVTHVLWA